MLTSGAFPKSRYGIIVIMKTKNKKIKYYRSLITGNVFRKSDFKTNAKKGGICFSHHKKENIKSVNKKFNNIFDNHLAKRKLIGGVIQNGKVKEYLFR